MKVLWTVNILFPEAKALLENKQDELASSGGWLIGAAETLSDAEGVELHIACPADVPSTTRLQGKKITYHLFPGLQAFGEPFYGDHPELDSVFRDIIEEVQPDIIDIHGTEYAHSLSCLRAAGDISCAVTVQGLLYECAEHYRDGLSLWDILAHGKLFRPDILREETLFRRRAEVEKSLLSRVRHFIGRTAWDKASVLECSPGASYHICNETLRDAFYEGKWTYTECEKHSIFLSQGSYPLKGLHQMLRALPAILRQYPDTMLYVGGSNILGSRSNYARILSSIVRRHKLEDHIRFTGSLDAMQMKQRFLSSNVFVCPSSIENSSNSIGEAQVLGVPCIASRRGGNPSMIQGMGTLYDFDDIRALSDEVCRVFQNSPDFDNGPVREMALRRHDRETNCAALLGIYRELYNNNSTRQEV